MLRLWQLRALGALGVDGPMRKLGDGGLSVWRMAKAARGHDCG